MKWRIAALIVLTSQLLFGVSSLRANVSILSATGEFGCTQTTITYEVDNPGAHDITVARVRNLTTGQTLYSKWIHHINLQTPVYSTTLPYQSQNSGDVLVGEVEIYRESIGPPWIPELLDTMTTNTGTLSDCPTPVELPEEPCGDGRLDTNCQSIAIYPNMDEGGSSITVWIVYPGNSTGSFGFHVTAEELAALPGNPEEPIMVIHSGDNYATLYWLPSNEYQINVGPNEENKVFVYRFTTLPGPIEFETFILP
jgi:hypothetical protein